VCKVVLRLAGAGQAVAPAPSPTPRRPGGKFQENDHVKVNIRGQGWMDVTIVATTLGMDNEYKVQVPCKGIATATEQDLRFVSAGTPGHRCPNCGGAGRAPCYACTGRGQNPGAAGQWEVCSVCNGRTTITCTTCFGSGSSPI
jgi:hypothetical protein